jgi:hypothetical protein
LQRQLQVVTIPIPANRRKLTPPQLGRLWGICPSKIILWIQRGELRAINGVATPGGKPRYLIDVADIAAFEAARSVTPPPKAPRRRRAKASGENPFFGPDGQVLRTI